MAPGTAWHVRVDVAFLLASILLMAVPSRAATTKQFHDFYPQHGDKYKFILEHNCSQEYANYLTGRPQDFEIDWLGGGSPVSVLVQPVVKCLLENISEYIKAASSSAQVLLGVTPPILATLGASTDELAMLSVIGRRPLLGLLLAFGSPSVYMDRVFDFRQPEMILAPTRGRYHAYRPDTKFKMFLLTSLQYVLALAAVTNIAVLNWQLGVGTLCAWWPETIFGPLVWGVLSVPIHLGGIFSVRLRLRRVNTVDGEGYISPGEWVRGIPRRLLGFAKTEWIPGICQDDIRTISFAEGKTYVVWSWFSSTATVIHIIFGSLLLSSLLFIGPRDSLIVIFRYIISVLACRVVVMFELAGMRENYVNEIAEEKEMEIVQVDGKMLKFSKQEYVQRSPVQRSPVLRLPVSPGGRV
ncbi:hypothetical protein GGS20DRAFT_201955 [Poronia punctata]|nr:hypothetical protein GGS20DRAFT_201955 [Poronia punctata]